MAFTQLVMENPPTGARKLAPVGLSWTVLLFGFLPPLFRGDIKWGVIILLFWLFSAGLTNIVFMFIYNKLYIKELMLEGFKLREIPLGMEARVRDNLNMTLPQ